METVRTELEELTFLLRTELSQARHPAIVRCDSCISLQNQLEDAQKKNQSLSSRVQELDKQLSLSRKIREENDSLKTQLNQKQEQGSYQSLTGELSIEKQRRIKAEQELAIYRKQGKTSDEKIAVNAKRVAVALAQHCLELTEEIRKLKGGVGRVDPSPHNNVHVSHDSVAQLVAGSDPTSLKIAAWGLDDDIFDEQN
jgi:Xaa-Pro aminopeptidase